MNKTQTATQPTSEVMDALRELFSAGEWKETFKHIHNDPEALRTLSVFGYAISFALGGLATILLIAAFG